MMKRILLLTMILIQMSFTPLFGSKMSTDKIKYDNDNVVEVILLDDDSAKYNEYLKSAVEKYWTYCAYKFVKQSDVDKYEDKKKVLLLGHFANNFDHLMGKYTLMSTSIFGMANMYRSKENYSVQTGSIRAFHPYPEEGIEEKYLEAELVSYVKFINNYVIHLGMRWSQRRAEYKERLAQAKEKTLYIANKVGMELTEEEIKKIYSAGKFEFVDREKVCDAILNEEDVLFYRKIKKIKYTFQYLINAKTSEIHFEVFGSHGNTKSQQKFMFKKINKSEK